MGNTTENKQSEKKKRCLIAFFIMLLLFLPYAFLEPVSSDTNDDTAMNLIAAGAFGENSQFIVYSNVLYGYFLKVLFLLVPSVNWYLWIALLCNALAAALLGAVAAYFLEYKALLPVLVLWHFYIAGEFYRSVQFTRNGYLYAICGMVLLVMGGIVSNYRKKVSVLGGAMLFLSFLVRKECLIPMLPFMAVLLLRQFLKDRKKCVLAVKVLVCAGAVCGVAALADQYGFWKRAEWQAYYDYHFNGTYPLLDDDINHWYSFDPEHMDFEMNDLMMLMEYQYADFDYFSVEYMAKMRGNRVESGLGAQMAAMASILGELWRFPEVPDYVNVTPGLHSILYDAERFFGWNLLTDLVLLAAVLYSISKKRMAKSEYLWIVLFLGCMVFDLFAVVYAAGHTPRRATIGFRMAFEILSALVLLLGAAEETAETAKNDVKPHKTIAWIVPAAALLFAGTLRVMNYTAQPEQTETGMVLEELRSFDGEYYVLDAMLLWGERLGITDLRQLNRTNYENYFEHFVLSGGWVAEIGPATHYLREQGITDPMVQLGRNPHFHYVVRSWKAEQLASLMNDYLLRRCTQEIAPRLVYGGEEVYIVDFYAATQ